MSRILVVEDNKDLAEGLRILLEARGHVVHAVTGGQAALESVGERTPDIVLLDIGLPGIDGYEVARRMRAEPRLAKVMLVAVTGSDGEEHRSRSREAGFDQLLVKPVDVEEIEQLIARCASTSGEAPERPPPWP